jgi:hypothetical protein
MSGIGDKVKKVTKTTTTGGLDKVAEKVEEKLVPDMPEPPPMPGTEEKTAMPLPDGDAARKARRKAFAVMRSRSGRASTILSDTLG